jgi:signal transduction histidine kinase
MKFARLLARTFAKRVFHASFETRVVGISLIAALSALTISFALFIWETWNADQAYLAREQTTVAQHVVMAAGDLDPSAIASARAILAADDDPQTAIYFADDGRRVTLSAERVPPDLRPLGLARIEVRSHIDGLDIHAPYYIDGRRAGELVMRVGNTAAVASLQRNLAISAGLLVLATLLNRTLAKILARRVLRSLNALSRGIKAVRRSEDFSTPLEITADDEIGRLTRDFNGLLETLQHNAELRDELTAATVARDTAEQASLMKSQFLANMSHEIRTPLNGVLGMAQVMSAHRLSRDQRARLDVIHQSGSALLSILNDVLDLSKGAAGELGLEVAAFDLQETATLACGLFAAEAEAKGIRFGLHIDDAAKGEWLGDALRVRQVIHKLASNALKFTEQGGALVDVGIDRAAEPPRLTIRVSDTGLGMTPESQARLFEPFTQGDATTTRRFGGAGLGLAICRQIVTLMDGEIVVKSRLGRGTQVTVTLPLRQLTAAPASKPVETEDAPSDLSQLRVLVAEDNPANRMVLMALLQAMGVEPQVVNDGHQAVRAWADGKFDLILMDIQMPELDGIGATRQIRSLERTCGRPRTRIVAVTANVMSHQLVDYRVAGMDGHVAKPIAAEALLAALLAALPREPAELAAVAA